MLSGLPRSHPACRCSFAPLTVANRPAHDRWEESRPVIYFRDRQQDEKKEHCHRRSLIFTAGRQEPCNFCSTKGTGKGQRNLIFEQRAAGDIKASPHNCVCGLRPILEIHTVFPPFYNFRMRQNLWPNALAKLCGAALKEYTLPHMQRALVFYSAAFSSVAWIILSMGFCRSFRLIQVATANHSANHRIPAMIKSCG